MKNNFKIHNYRILQNENDIFISVEKNNLILDIKELLPLLNSHTKQDKQSIQEYNVLIAFYGYILTGGDESKSLGYECFFGELESSNLDSHNTMGLDESKPIYHLINETDSNSIEYTSNNKDSSNSLSTLNIFLANSNLTLLNYSLLDSSLNAFLTN